MDNNKEDVAWLEALLKENKFENQISHVCNIKVEPLTSNGDFYSSVISIISVEVMLCCGKKTTISLVQKKDLNAKDEDTFEGFPVVKKEVKVYKEVLERFDNLMELHQDFYDKLWCNLIGHKPYTLILLENIKDKHFKTVSRKKLLDLNHALITMHNLGRFHALGHVSIQKGFVSKTDFPQHYLESDGQITSAIFKNGIKELSRAMERNWSPKWKYIALRLAKQESIVLEKLRSLFTMSNDCFATTCHGDCWTCNIFFKYCPYDHTLPIATKFIDFQTMHVNSFIFDIVHFLSVCVQPEVRFSHFDQLVSVYLKSMQSTLAIYGMESQAPTAEHVHAEAKRIEYYSFVYNILFLPITISEVDNAFNFMEILLHGNSGPTFKAEVFSSEKCQQILGPLIEFWFEKNMF